MQGDNDGRNLFLAADFREIPAALRRTAMSGYILKKGQNFKSWKRRYFVLEGGLLKYYRREIKSTGKGDDLKGQVGICGLSIMCADDHSRRYTLKSPSEKEGRELEFENDQQAEEWIKALQSAVFGINYQALVDGSRTPEVVEWYYWMESSFLEIARELDAERPFQLTYDLDGFNHNSAVMLSLSADSLGLLLRFDTSGKRMNEVESRNDGRIVLFRDIYKMECFYAQSKKSGRVLSTMKIILYTQEDNLVLESLSPLEEVENWVTVARECIMFCLIPVPEAHPDTSLRAVSSARDGFRSTSGVVFGANVDVTFLINSVLEDPSIRNETFPSIAKLCQYVGDIFSLIRDVKCNRDAFGAFSGRLADLMRLFLDAQAGGLLMNVSESDSGLVTFQLNGMCSKGLTDALDFVQAMCNPEWLQAALKFGIGGFRAKFEQFEQEILIKCANRIIIGLSGDKKLTFKKYKYDMVVEVNQSLAAIGSTDQIYANPAKIQAFARVVQGDPTDIFNELELVLEKENKLTATEVDSSSYDTVSLSNTDKASDGRSTSTVTGVEQPQSKGGGGIFARMCCCCFKGKKTAKPTLRRKSYKFSNSGNGLDQKLLNNRAASGDSRL